MNKEEREAMVIFYFHAPESMKDSVIGGLVYDWIERSGMLPYLEFVQKQNRTG